MVSVVEKIVEYEGLIANVWIGILMALVVHHIAISSVSILLHRADTHRSIELSPMLEKIMHWIIRCNSPVVRKEWVAAHKQHHAQSDIKAADDRYAGIGDPHSPQPISGNALQIFVKRFLNINFSSYMQAVDMLYKEDKIKGSKPGVLARVLPMIGLGIVYIILFGVGTAIIMAFIQAILGRATITLVNGVGHSSGEIQGKTNDYSKNITLGRNGIFSKFWDYVVLNYQTGGEHLHGFHHEEMWNPDISLGRKGYFDLGFFYIRMLYKIGLVKKIRSNAA